MRCAWLAGAACAAAGAVLAQAPPPQVLTQQHGGVYIEPPAAVDPAYLPEGPNAPTAAAPQAQRLSLQLTLDLPLRRGSSASLGRGVQGSTAASPTLQAQFRWTPLPASYWFAQLTVYRYLQPDRQQPWHPDFSYVFGYDDPRPGTWSLFYSNYTGTRFEPDAAAGEHRFNFPEGQWTLARRFELPPTWQPVLLVGDGDQALCSAEAHLTPRFVRLEGGVPGRDKASLSLGCRYTRPSGWYAEAAVFAWPVGGQQQPWDPDFTYGFGYANWRPGTLAIRYNNYSGNRFPGRALGPGEGRPSSGSVSISWSVPW